MDYQTSQETWLRLWRLEERQQDIKDKIKDHEARIETLEEAPQPSMMSAAGLKEAGMLVVIGILVGTILASKDPAGAIGIIERLLHKG